MFLSKFTISKIRIKKKSRKKKWRCDGGKEGEAGIPPSLPPSLHFGGQESYGGCNRRSASFTLWSSF